MNTKDMLKILRSYNINSTIYGPSIFKKGNEIGLCLEIKDSSFGFLTRYFTFDNKTDLENFLKMQTWYKKNKKKWNITTSLDNYEIPNPKIIYTYDNKELKLEDMLNLENIIDNREKEAISDIEKDTALINLEGLTNYLINIKNLKLKTKKEKNDLKIQENELKYELLESLNNYYGKTKIITKRPVNLDIINSNNNDNILLQENLKNIKQKDLTEMNNYLDSLINIIKEEELDEKYLLNIYSNEVYKYNIDILKKQIEFVKKKIASEKNFNLKGSKIHNIDEELKSFVKVNNAPTNIKTFLNSTKNKLEEKYNKITDNKNSYSIISGTLVRMPVRKISNTKNKVDALDALNKDFDNLSAQKKAYIILYNSFYKDICEIIKNNFNSSIEELKALTNIEKSYKDLEEIIFREENSHYLANYFKYINFKNIDTYLNSIIEITKTVMETNFYLVNSLKVFCIEKKNNKELLSINPIFNKKDKIYITTLPASTKLLYIPDKIKIDYDTKEMNTISTQNIYLKSEIIDTSDSIIVNKYKKINELDKVNDIIITKDLVLKDSYVFNVGLIEGE